MRIGCLGLNANPPHLGHRLAAEAFRWSGFVDQVWLIPTFAHPFGKQDIASWEHRVNMCRLLENQDIGIWVSLAECEMLDYEEYKHDKSYTIYTLEYLRKLHPNFQFIWCVGSDIVTSGSYRDWHRWEELEKEDKILVAERAVYPLPSFALPRPFVQVPSGYRDISSTHIRVLSREGMDITKYAGEKIAEYIRKHKLYKGR